MTPKAQKLLPKIEKAGIKASLKAGHPINEEELLAVKVQLLPTLYRWGLGGISAASGYGSYAGFTADSMSQGLGMAALSLLFFFFAVVGVRQTLGTILESMDGVDAGQLLGAALDGIGAVIGSVFEGL